MQKATSCGFQPGSTATGMEGKKIEDKTSH